jgi:hypothetical protein
MPGDEETRVVFGPVRAGWREATLTRATEIEAIATWLKAGPRAPGTDAFFAAAADHVLAARQAATFAPLDPKTWLRRPRGGAAIERALSNLDAAETMLLNAAPPDYLLGMMPSVLSNVRCHLVADDARRQRLEVIAGELGTTEPKPAKNLGERLAVVIEARGEIVAAMRAARSAALREQVRIRNFRNVVACTTVGMALVALLIGFAGFRGAWNIPLCFTPQEGEQAVVVCPTGQSHPYLADRFAGVQAPASESPTPAPAASPGPAAPATPAPSPSPAASPSPTTSPAAAAPSPSASAGFPPDIDDIVKKTVSPWDVAIVELMGLLAAAVAAAVYIRGIKGSSERHSVLVWLAALKLPTGAVTAFLGLMLMRGAFVPGLSALDTSAQILAWALVFGYAQQLFTGLVDRQGQAVLNSVRAADTAQQKATPQ